MDVREKLVEILEEPCGGLYPACELADYLLDQGVTVQEWIEQAPTIDAVPVAPVRHGHWECQKPCPVCGENRFKGLDADIWADWEPPYCPNCGAKMDEKVSE